MCIAFLADFMCLLYLQKQIFINRYDTILKIHNFFEDITTKVVFFLYVKTR